MKKVLLIIKREYLSRVKKGSFLLMTFLTPLFLAALMVFNVWISNQEEVPQRIMVIDDSYLFTGLLPQKELIKFDYPDISFEKAQDIFYSTDYDAILNIPRNIVSGGRKVVLMYKEPVGKATEEYITSTIGKMVYDVMLAKDSVPITTIRRADVNSRIQIVSKKLKISGKTEKDDSGVRAAIGFAAGFLILIFIFMYGLQVMQGVMEEKSNRIVEVILSSVKPFQFMMGKILGVAFVGLTQFVLWTSLTIVLYGYASDTILQDVEMKQIQQKEEVIKVGADLKYMEMKKVEKPNIITQLWNEFQTVDMVDISLSFLFYFLIGYFLYSALFAAVGSAIDNESDTQQFRLPIMMPLIFAFISIPYVILNLDSPITYWLSIIPFTSPVIMMVRLAFGVPTEELFLSMTLLVITFVFVTWLAARIYRIGILMYGKKASWKEIGKWIFYKG